MVLINSIYTVVDDCSRNETNIVDFSEENLLCDIQCTCFLSGEQLRNPRTLIPICEIPFGRIQMQMQMRMRFTNANANANANANKFPHCSLCVSS